MKHTSFTESQAKRFVDRLIEEAFNHRAVKHPFLDAIANGDLPSPKDAIIDFTYQYLAYSTEFQRYLTYTISSLEDRKHRQSLIHNLAEETGHLSTEDEENLVKAGINVSWVKNIAHPDLFRRFIKAIGIDLNTEKHYCDEVIAWRESFLACCSSGDASRSIGAIGIGTETIVKEIYKPIIKGISRFLNVKPKDRVFFDLHVIVDDDHGLVMRDIAIEYARYRRHQELLRTGMLMALNLRAAFFDAMLLRARAMPKSKMKLAG